MYVTFAILRFKMVLGYVREGFFWGFGNFSNFLTCVMQDILFVYTIATFH